MPILNVLTQGGSDLIWRGIAAGKVLEFTRAVFGSGNPTKTTVADLEKMTSLVKPYADTTYGKPLFSGRKIDVRGNLIITLEFNNSSVRDSMTVSEIGIYAKLKDEGTERLFSYLWFGDTPDIITPVGTAAMTRIYDIPFVVAGGTGENVTITIEPQSLIPASKAVVDPNDNTAGLIPMTGADGKLRFDTHGSAGSVRAADGTTYPAEQLLHPGNLDNFTATETAAGTMSAAQVMSLATLLRRVTQDLTADSTPTFKGLRVDGYIDGAKFR